MKNPCPITFYVSAPTKEEIIKLADEENRAVSNMVSRLIDEALANRAYERGELSD